MSTCQICWPEIHYWFKRIKIRVTYLTSRWMNPTWCKSWSAWTPCHPIFKVDAKDIFRSGSRLRNSLNSLPSRDMTTNEKVGSLPEAISLHACFDCWSFRRTNTSILRISSSLFFIAGSTFIAPRILSFLIVCTRKTVPQAPSPSLRLTMKPLTKSPGFNLIAGGELIWSTRWSDWMTKWLQKNKMHVWRFLTFENMQIYKHCFEWKKSRMSEKFDNFVSRWKVFWLAVNNSKLCFESLKIASLLDASRYLLHWFHSLLWIKEQRFFAFVFHLIFCCKGSRFVPVFKKNWSKVIFTCIDCIDAPRSRWKKESAQKLIAFFCLHYFLSTIKWPKK